MHALKRGFVLVRPHARALRRDAPLRIDVGHLGHHQPGGAERERAEVHQVPVIGRAVVGIVLAHWRHRDAVGQSEPAQDDRRKQNASHRFAFPFDRFRIRFSPRCRRSCRRASPPPGRQGPRTSSIRSHRYSTATCRSLCIRQRRRPRDGCMRSRQRAR